MFLSTSFYYVLWHPVQLQFSPHIWFSRKQSQYNLRHWVFLQLHVIFLFIITGSGFLLKVFYFTYFFLLSFSCDYPAFGYPYFAPKLCGVSGLIGVCCFGRESDYLQFDISSYDISPKGELCYYDTSWSSYSQLRTLEISGT